MFRTKITPVAAALTLAALTLGSSAEADTKNMGQVNLHGGLGIDAIGQGAAFNVGLGYRAPMNTANWIEGAFDVYHHSSEDAWVEGNYEGVESFMFTVVAARCNMLLGYERAGIHPVVGFGLFAAGVEWAETENFIGDPTNKSYDDFEGTVFGNIFNLGLGMPLGEKADLRIEVPVMIFWGAERNSVGIPLTVSAGMRF